MASSTLDGGFIYRSTLGTTLVASFSSFNFEQTYAKGGEGGLLYAGNSGASTISFTSCTFKLA